jgi:N-acetylmuramoyl-L-alanine amidase
MPKTLLVVVRRRLFDWMLVLAGFAVLVAVMSQLAVAPSPGERYPLVGRLIVVDPGHGGIDGGCSDSRGFLEKDVTLDVALRLRKLLAAEGAFILMTRETDRDVSPFGDATGGRHRRDLSGRVRLARESGAEAMVSIHVNSSSDLRTSGAITFYQRNSRESQRLGELVQTELVAIQPGNRETAWPNNFYVLEYNPGPTALVEIGYLSNPHDRAQLVTPAYRQKVAEALYRALQRYFAAVPQR